MDLSRCAAGTCPAEALGLTCPRDTRYHPYYCGHYRTDPALWGPAIVGSAREDAAPPTGQSVPGPSALDALREWYDALPPAVKAAVRDCPLRVVEPNRGCCGADALVCRGGSRDDQVVLTIDCARCVAAGGDSPRKH